MNIPAIHSDVRLEFLRTGSTPKLIALLSEIVGPSERGCSQALFLIGMDSRFRTTTQKQLFDLIAQVLRDRVSEGSEE
jgi:hypothetical protein